MSDKAALDADEIIEQIRKEAIRYFSEKVLTLVLAWGGMFKYVIVQKLAAFVIQKIMEVAIRETELGIYVIYANEKAEAQAREYENARRQLNQLPSNASQSDRDAARRRVVDAARDLIRLNR